MTIHPPRHQQVRPEERLRQGCERPWEVAIDPFIVAPGTYYVGNEWVGAYLLESTEGLILIDSTMQPQIYLLFESIRKLGFDPRDIRLLLLTHMHYDHLGGARAIVEMSGAKVMMSREDTQFLADRPEQLLADGYPCGAFEVDAFYNGNQPIVFGGRRIDTLLTPGHTPGTTSFFFDATDAEGRTWRCGMHGGVGLNTLTDEFLTQWNFPVSWRGDYIDSLKRMRALKVDIALGSHPAIIRMFDKVDQIRPDFNPFLDPTVWPAFIDGRLAAMDELINASTL